MRKAFKLMRVTAFRNKYPAAVITLAFVLASLFAQSQIYINPNPGTWGSGDHRRYIDSALFYPTGCGVPSGTASLNSVGFGSGQKMRMSAFYYDSCGHKLWVYDPSSSTWAGFSSGVIDTTSLSNRINLRMTFLDTTLMLFPYAQKITTVANGGGAPSFAEDVAANRPAAGNPGVMFLATDTKLLYRDNGFTWDLIGSGGGGGGITPSNVIKQYLNGYANFVTFNTDSIAEGATNKYYTDARSRAAISFTTPLTGNPSYNNSTGALAVPTISSGGSGFRVALPGSNQLRSLFCVGCTIDSITNTSGLTFTVSGGSGNTNSNVGSFFRLALPGTNNIKTLAPGVWAKMDSTSNTNAITIYGDSAAIAAYLFRRTDIIPAGNLPTTNVLAGRGLSVTNVGGVPMIVLGMVSGQVLDSVIYISLGGTKDFTIDSAGTHLILKNIANATPGAGDSALNRHSNGQVFMAPVPSGGGGGSASGSAGAIQLSNGSGSFTNSTPLNYVAGTGTLNTPIVAITRAAFNKDTVRISGLALMLAADGDSYTVGQGATPVTQGFAFLLDSVYGYLPFLNLGVNGSGSWMATNKAYQNIQPGHQTLTSLMTGYNNRRVGTAGQGGGINVTRKIMNGHNAIICNQFNKAVINAWNGAGVTASGSVTQFNGTGFGAKAGANCATSAAAGDTVAYAFNDSTVFVAGLGSDSGASPRYYSENIQFIIDGTAVLTASEDNQSDGVDPSGDSYNNQIVPMTWHFTGLTYGPHVIKVVNKTVHSYPMILDYFGNFVDASKQMPIIIFETPRMDATGYAISGFAGANDAIIDASNVSLDSTEAKYPPSFQIFDVNTNFYTNTTTDENGDHIHKNNTGHIHIMQGATAALPVGNINGVSYGSLPAGTIDYATPGVHVLADGSGMHRIVREGGLEKGKYPIGTGGVNGNPLYNNKGIIGGLSMENVDTINHGHTFNLTALTPGSFSNLTAVRLVDTSAAILSQFRNPPWLLWDAQQWLTGTGSQHVTYMMGFQGHTGSPINGFWQLNHQINGGTVVNDLYYQPGTGFGVNSQSIAGILDATMFTGQVYGNVVRLPGGASLTNLGPASTTQGFLGFNQQVTQKGILFDAVGNINFNGTGASILNPGTTAQRPGTPLAGMWRYNTDSAAYEWYNTAWHTVGSGGAGGSSYAFTSSLINASGTVTLVNDNGTPGNSKYYGTDGTGTHGYFALPAGLTPGGTTFNMQYDSTGGVMAGAPFVNYDPTNHGLINAINKMGNTRLNASGVFLANDTAAATNGFQNGGSFGIKVREYNTTAGADQYMVVYASAQAKSAAINEVNYFMGFQNNNGTDVDGMVMAMGPSQPFSWGLNQTRSFIPAGILDAQNGASASYGFLDRVNGNAHFAHFGMQNGGVIGVLGVDGTLTGSAMINYTATGNLMAPGGLAGGTQTDAGNGWLQAAASNATRAGVYLAGATVDPTTPLNGMMWHNSTAGTYNIRVGGATINLAALAPLASPTFTGTPSLPTGTTAVTQTVGDNSTKVATTAFVIANAAGGSGVTTVGTFSGSSQTNGAGISGSTITFGPADATNPGMVTTGAQTIAGVKTFNNTIAVGANVQVLHLVSTNTGGSVTAGTGAGTGPTVSFTGVDQTGILTIVTGSAPSGSGATIVTFTYSGTYPTNTFPVLFPGNAAAAALTGATSPFAVGAATNFALKSGSSGLAASTTYIWNYYVGGQ